ncbi:hypothetical protein LCGC14_1971380 [marine sediment metagenome]|uniref:Uncharacterized protein n=1 Tax=marine sediment metagenome TaxID=412755 RepID=A0A0F9I8Q5_9ZZZZ
MGEVLRLHDVVAQCPHCEDDRWYIHVDGFGDTFKNVTGHECISCGFKVDIKIEVVREE